MAAFTAEDASPTLFFSPVAPRCEPLARGEHQDVLRAVAARNRRGHVALCSGDLDAAERYFREALDLRQNAGASAHPGLPQAFGRLGIVAFRRGDLTRAETLFELGLEVARALRPRLTRQDAMLLQNLGVTARRLGRLDEAEGRHAGALSIKVQALGWAHPSVAITLGSLGVLFLLQRRPGAALQHLARARDIAARVSGEGSTCAARWQLLCGCAHLQRGDHDRAERSFAAAVATYELLPGAKTPLAAARLRLATARWRLAPAAARRLAADALADYAASAHPDPRQLQRMRTWLESHVEQAA